MKINLKVYQKIVFDCPCAPPEVGVIMGGKNGIISEFDFDFGLYHKDDFAIYIPNVSLINHKISRWIDQGIDFYGIAHSHLEGAEFLSTEDEIYIKNILSSMPSSVPSLYFPLIIPGKNILGYKAQKVTSGIVIQSESVDIEAY